MLEGEPIRTRGAQEFEKQYLRKGFSDKITVYRILNSRREKFALSKLLKAGKIEKFGSGRATKYKACR